MLASLLIVVFIVVAIPLVLILTDLWTVSPQRRALASKLATVLFLAIVVWVFVAIAMGMD